MSKNIRFIVEDVGPAPKEKVYVTFTRSKNGSRIVTVNCPADGIQLSEARKIAEVSAEKLARTLCSSLWWRVDTLDHGKRLAAALEHVIKQLRNYNDRSS